MMTRVTFIMIIAFDKLLNIWLCVELWCYISFFLSFFFKLKDLGKPYFSTHSAD